MFATSHQNPNNVNSMHYLAVLTHELVQLFPPSRRRI